MDNKKITISGFEQLRKIIEEGKIPLQNIDIKNSNITSFYDEESQRGLFQDIDFEKVNGTIKDWNVTSITNLKKAFYNAKNIPKNELENWDISNVKSLQGTFYYSDFNGDISKWNTKNVETLEVTFCGTIFNGDISKWDVSNVKNMDNMFFGSKFNKDISNWDFYNLASYKDIFLCSSISKEKRLLFIKKLINLGKF